MIRAVTVINALGESLRMDLFDPEQTGFIITSIDGLGPAKATINFTELATIDGSVDNSARVGTRNIVLALQFLEHPTIEATRLQTYRYFPIKQMVTLRIETDTRLVETEGRVESNEPDIFSKEEGCQISILCPDPYLYATGAGKVTKTEFFGAEPLFEFPFSNESLNEDLIEISSIEQYTDGVVVYDGDAEVGITLKIHAVGHILGIQIFNMDTREILALNDDAITTITGEAIKSGDDITIETRKGKKYVSLLRDGVSYNIINALEKPIVWFQIAKGENTFAYTATSGLGNMQLTIESRNAYEGV